MSIEDQLLEIVRQVAAALNVPYEWLTFPNILFFLILPVIVSTYFFYSLLQKLRLLSSGYGTSIPNIVISFIFGLVTTVIGGISILYLSIPGIAVLKVKNMILKIILVVIALIVVSWAITFIYGLVI